MKYVYSEEYLEKKLEELRKITSDDINTKETNLKYLIYLCNKYNLSMDFFVIVEK